LYGQTFEMFPEIAGRKISTAALSDLGAARLGKASGSRLVPPSQ
jgi:hypothetical protein